MALSMDSSRCSLPSMRSHSKSRFRVLRRGPAARSLCIRITCASYRRPPLGDGMLRSLRTTTAAAAGSAANSSKSGRNRAARSVAACKILWAPRKIDFSANRGSFWSERL
jgi:hypothetical protein